MLKKVLPAFGVMLLLYSAGAQALRDRWADSVSARLAPHEKIGQLFVLQVAAPASEADFDALVSQIKRYHPGGIEFTNLRGADLKSLTSRLRALAPVPLLIGADENQALMEVDPGYAFPGHLQLAAVPDDSLARKIYGLAAAWVAHQGLSYTTGLNLNPLAFDSDDWKEQTRQAGRAPQTNSTPAGRWFSQLEQHNLVAVPSFQSSGTTLTRSKGDTLRLPAAGEFAALRHPGIRIIRSSDFRFQIRSGNKQSPAALSSAFITDVIRRQLQVDGLLCYATSDSDRGNYLDAFLAGNELIATPAVDARQMNALRRALRRNKLFQSSVNQALHRLLTLKYDCQARPQPAESDHRGWNTAEKRVLFQQVFETSITLLKNEAHTLPIKNLDLEKIGILTIGQHPDRAFERRMEQHAQVIKATWRQEQDSVPASKLISRASLLVIAVYDPARSVAAATWLKKAAQGKRVVVCHMAGVAHLDVWQPFDALLAGYTPTKEVQQAMAQNLFGVQPGNGLLPVAAPWVPTVSPAFESLPRFAFAEPEAVGMDHETLQKIEPIVQEAISRGATPGAHIVIARRGKVIYQRSFGTLSYVSATPVTDSTLYDLASVTKVSATLQAVMFMHEKNLIDLNKKASVYLPELKGTNKEDMVLMDILTHQAGLWPFLPFWASTMKDSIWLREYYQPEPSPDYPWPVAENLFAQRAMKDSLWTWIIRSKVRDKLPRTPYDYRYSDMGFYILQHLAETLLNQPMDEFLRQNLYEPVGAFSLGYLPRTRYAPGRIAPTEEDKLFRKSLLVGYVHDQGAAMHGGIAGHAGLFGTGLDLAKLGQLWLNRGVYGDTRFFRPETLDLFTTRTFASSRRGLGWDKPILNDWSSPTALAASPQTFGHTGFTGTCVWVDPAYDLVYVFLSNRVHPDMTNNRLLNLNIRPRIQEVVYRSIFNFSLYQPAIKN